MTVLTDTAGSYYGSCGSTYNTGTSEQAGAACEAADIQLSNLLTQNASLEERDYIWLLRAATLLSAGSAHVTADTVRSRRACDAIERSWQAVNNVSPSVTYPQDVAAVSEAILRVVRLCRDDMGAPAWGRSAP